MATNQTDKSNELVAKIQQFLTHQIQSNASLGEPAKESLTVACECIEQAYKLQKMPASNELLEIYSAHKQKQQTSTGPNSSGITDPTTLLQNLASTFMGAANSSATTATSNHSDTQATPSAPKVTKTRKIATDAEKMAAESFKNQGNDYMKQDKFKEAYDSYSEAIAIDGNNAIYFSNRAAALSKMGDHQAALKDCEEAIDIDPTYGKAYSRMALAYASMENHQKAKEAYIKAIELDPTNESYKNNLRAAEEKLNETANAQAGATGQPPNVANMIRSMMSNPQVMQMAMQSLQDPGVQSLLGAGASAAASAMRNVNQQQQSAQSTTTESPSQSSPVTGNAGAQQPPAADILNMTSRLIGSGNVDLLGVGQQFLSTMQQNNPDFVDNMRRMMSQAFIPPNNNQRNNDNPPPGYS